MRPGMEPSRPYWTNAIVQADEIQSPKTNLLTNPLIRFLFLAFCAIVSFGGFLGAGYLLSSWVLDPVDAINHGRPWNYYLQYNRPLSSLWHSAVPATPPDLSAISKNAQHQIVNS